LLETFLYIKNKAKTEVATVKAIMKAHSDDSVFIRLITALKVPYTELFYVEAMKIGNLLPGNREYSIRKS